MAASKEYGLIKRGEKDTILVRPRLSIFDEDDDSDEDGRKGVGKRLQKEANRINAKKQVKLNLQSALADDPTVFEYDTIYDDMLQKKNEEIGVKKKASSVKKSRYIDSLMRAARSRKLDQERATERKVHKEREAEGAIFADKEAFVTTAYRKKMEEMQEQEEKDRREAQLEALTDVTKQKDLSGFYRQLYRQTLSPKKETEKDEKDVSEKKKFTLEDETEKRDHDEDKDSDSSPSPDHDKPSSSSQNASESVRKPRQFRKQRKESTSSSSSSEVENEDENHQKRQKAANKRLRRQNRSSTTEDDELDKLACDKQLTTTKSSKSNSTENRKMAKSSSSTTSSSNPDSSDAESVIGGKEKRPKQRSVEGAADDKSKEDDRKKEKEKELPKITSRDKLLALFTKRNVGDAFEQARQRFQARREARNTERMNFTKESTD